MKYRLAIFDFDGTLVSSLDGIRECMTETLLAFGYPAPSLEEVRSTIGLTLEDSIRGLTKHQASKVQLPQMVRLYRHLHDEKAGLSIRLFDGVRKLLEELPSHGIMSALVTNKGRKGLEELLARLKIWAFFEQTLSAEDVEHQKPAPEVYLKHIAPQFPKIARAETIAIGDTEVDIQFAKAAGLASCWARYGYGDAAKCRALRPDYEMGEIKELRDILRAGGKS
jgi:phosphoglycolate phosphatase